MSHVLKLDLTIMLIYIVFAKLICSSNVCKNFYWPFEFQIETYLLKSKDTVWKGSLANLQNTYLRICYKPGDPIDIQIYRKKLVSFVNKRPILGTNHFFQLQSNYSVSSASANSYLFYLPDLLQNGNYFIFPERTN